MTRYEANLHLQTYKASQIMEGARLSSLLFEQNEHIVQILGERNVLLSWVAGTHVTVNGAELFTAQIQ